MKPALYIVEAPPSVVDQFSRVCARTGLPFKVRRTEPASPCAADDDGTDEVPVAPLLLRLSRAAEVLDVSESTLGRLIRSGQLPAVQLGGTRRVRTCDLEDFVDRLGGDGHEGQPGTTPSAIDSRKHRRVR